MFFNMLSGRGGQTGDYLLGHASPVTSEKKMLTVETKTVKMEAWEVRRHCVFFITGAALALTPIITLPGTLQLAVTETFFFYSYLQHHVAVAIPSHIFCARALTQLPCREA